MIPEEYVKMRERSQRKVGGRRLKVKSTTTNRASQNAVISVVGVNADVFPVVASLKPKSFFSGRERR